MTREEKRINRITITESIEETLNNYCRECPHIESNAICYNKCPIGKDLQGYGEQLGGMDEKGSPCIRWTEKDLQVLIDHHLAGLRHKEVGKLMGRTHRAVKDKVMEMRRIGRLPQLQR